MKISRTIISGAITLSIFVSKALSKFFPDNQAITTMTNPYVIFVLFCVAGIVLLWPFLKGWKAAILGPMLVLFAAFFVYAYYVLP
jgi:hypothetical protein